MDDDIGLLLVVPPDGRPAPLCPPLRAGRTGDSQVTGACVRSLRYEPCACQ